MYSPAKSAAGLFLGLCLTIFSVAGYAHHSAAQYDFMQRVPVTGKVILLKVANPHLALILEVTNPDGSTKQIEFEGHSRNNVYRKGWRPDSIKEGDVITVYIAPLRDGGDGGYVQDFVLADGRKF